MATRRYGSDCGVARALEIVGERWALLLVRDLLDGDPALLTTFAAVFQIEHASPGATLEG